MKVLHVQYQTTVANYHNYLIPHLCNAVYHIRYLLVRMLLMDLNSIKLIIRLRHGRGLRHAIGCYSVKEVVPVPVLVPVS